MPFLHIMPNITAIHSLQQRSRLSCMSIPRPHAHARAILARMSASCGPLDTIVKKFTNRDHGRRKAAELRLLTAIESTQRGLNASPSSKQEISDAVNELEDIGRDTVTTGTDLSATWRLLYTTEKETLFILKNAGWLGKEAGEVFQVIDVENGSLNNVITFRPNGFFIVDSSLDVVGEQRTEFKFRGAKVKLGNRPFSLPPFGQGWFDTVYLGQSLRVAKDIRGDTLVVERDGPPKSFL